MNRLRGAQFLLAFACSVPMAVHASNLDTIGVTLLQAVTTNINGAGIRVGQAEAGYGGTAYWEVNPGAAAVEQPTNLFTYYYGTLPYYSVSMANTFTNSLGLESGHADVVAGNFYGMSGGTATNVAHVDNYEANTFVNYYVNQDHFDLRSRGKPEFHLWQI